jgi:RNA polymerase sigma-70 factor (ECF subfamily)
MDGMVIKEEFVDAALPYWNELFRTAQYNLGNRNEAEDVVQETYLQAWKSFHRFTLGTNCRAWLFKILFHVIQHHRRKWMRLCWHSDNYELLKETLAYKPPIQVNLKDEVLLAALQKLAPYYREVISLADIQEYSYQEIATKLSIPIGTVMSRLHRGRKILKTELIKSVGAFGVKYAT